MLSLLTNYDRQRHLEIISLATNSKKMSWHSFSFLNDPLWVSKPSASASNPEIPFPKKIASHLIDSYYQLPERPDMAFIFLWMAINAAYQETAIRHSFAINKERISDDYGLDCALSALVSRFKNVIGVDGSFKTLEGHLEDLLKKTPQKILAMMATSWLRSIAAEHFQCSGRYTSRSYEALRKKFPALASAIENSYGLAYSELCRPFIDIETKEINYSIFDNSKAKSIIRSLSKKLGELLSDGAMSLQLRASKGTVLIKFSMEDRVRVLLRNGLYASRNNIAHGKVSSRLNSETANRESYSANIFIYISGYIFLSILLVELKYATPVVIRQALKNINSLY